MKNIEVIKRNVKRSIDDASFLICLHNVFSFLVRKDYLEKSLYC